VRVRIGYEELWVVTLNGAGPEVDLPRDVVARCRAATKAFVACCEILEAAHGPAQAKLDAEEEAKYRARLAKRRERRAAQKGRGVQ
jgi:hypothetical protein